MTGYSESETLLPWIPCEDITVMDDIGQGKVGSDARCKSARKKKTAHASDGPSSQLTHRIPEGIETTELLSDSDQDIFPSRLISPPRKPQVKGNIRQTRKVLGSAAFPPNAPK